MGSSGSDSKIWDVTGKLIKGCGVFLRQRQRWGTDLERSQHVDSA